MFLITKSNFTSASWVSFFGEVWFFLFMIFFKFSAPEYTFVSYSFLLPSLSFRKIVVSGLHYFPICFSYGAFEQLCCDWHSALASSSLALFLLSFCSSTRLQCSLSLSLNCLDNVLEKPEEAWRPLQSRGLCSPLQMTALFHLFSWRKTKGKIEQGIRQPN